jgi:hypothetical protein
VKPIDNIGGVLGGTKFIAQGILFKHAVSDCMWQGGRKGRRGIDAVEEHA